jgi:hypothetical protein
MACALSALFVIDVEKYGEKATDVRFFKIIVDTALIIAFIFLVGGYV